MRYTVSDEQLTEFARKYQPQITLGGRAVFALFVIFLIWAAIQAWIIIPRGHERGAIKPGNPNMEGIVDWSPADRRFELGKGKSHKEILELVKNP